MRYHIDTIPVWDAAKIDSECLLCALQRRLELQQIEYSLGASVMEPDVRIQVNKRASASTTSGCCSRATIGSATR